MSSPPGPKGEMKGGHLPAESQGRWDEDSPKTPGHPPEPAPEKEKKEEEKEGEEAESGGTPKPTVIVSGVVTKGDRDFTPAAAQVAHQKPMPCVEKLPPPYHINQHIHQPRK